MSERHGANEFPTLEEFIAHLDEEHWSEITDRVNAVAEDLDRLEDRFNDLRAEQAYKEYIASRQEPRFGGWNR